MALQFEKLGWGVAENPTQHDLGTDLWLQARDVRGFDLGALIGAQVKSGESWFKSPRREDGEIIGWWFSETDTRHAKYWTDHRVPHLLILHSQESEVSYWVHVTREEIVSTGKGIRIFVPKARTVDQQHFKDLVQVATAGRPGAQWEGSSWDGGKLVLSADRLRYALLTPRLIAPHPNLTVSGVSAEAVIAAIVKMRIGDLMPGGSLLSQSMGADEAENSPEWNWRFYAAIYHHLLSQAGLEPFLELIDAATDSFQRAAATAFVCAMSIEEGNPGFGLEVATAELERDECSPVDHAWVLVHKARCLAELGHLEKAYELAIEVQNMGGVSTDDPTVMAIVGASADLIFTVSGWHPNNIPTAINGRDTLAAWWRTQEVAWGLQHNWDAGFKEWARDPRRRIGSSDEMRLRLRTASLIAGLSGDHSAWRHTAGMFSQRALTAASYPGRDPGVVESLRLLRRVGDSDSIKLAARHLLRNGPAQAVSESACEVDLQDSTRTSVQADLHLIRLAADVLTQEDIDRHIGVLLKCLLDPDVLSRRLRPTFHVKSAVLETLAALVSGASLPAIRRIVDHLVSLPIQEDQGDAHDYAGLLASVPTDAWTNLDRDALAARADCDNFEFVEAIHVVLARSNPEFRSSQLPKIASGDLAALSAFGDVRDLDAVSVQGLVIALCENVKAEVEELRGGAHSIGGWNSASILALVNRWHPEVADWRPIIDLLEVDTLFSEHLTDPLRQIKRLGAGVPPDVVKKLIGPLKKIISDPSPPDPFFGSADVSGHAAAALAAIAPESIGEEELWELLAGDTPSRVAAVLVIAARDGVAALTTLAALARDSDALVKAEVAFSLAQWVSQGEGGQLTVDLLSNLLNDPGTLVAKAVAGQLEHMTPSDSTAQLAEGLKNHRSGSVRRAVSRHGKH